MIAMGLLDEKKQENIAGYVISMWHIEDLLRAEQFDLDRLEEHLIAPMDADPDTREEVRHWYADLVDQMKQQGLELSGHLLEVEEVMGELEFLHSTLVGVLDDHPYKALFSAAEPGIKLLQEQAGENKEGPIATCFTAIYGVMLLRAQNKPISKGTTEAESDMRKLLEHLSMHYKQMRKLPGVSLN